MTFVFYKDIENPSPNSEFLPKSSPGDGFTWESSPVALYSED